MKDNSTFLLGVKKFFRDKRNIILVILISLVFSLILFGFSYIKSINNYWDNSMKKLVDYRTYIVTFDKQKYNLNTAIEKLKSYEHVVEVFDEKTYLISMTVKDDKIVKDKNNGIFLIGSIKTPINIIEGDDLSNYSGNEIPLICAKQFYPFIEYKQENYVKSKNIDLTNKIGYSFNMSFITSNELEKVKIVGLYDAEENHTQGNVCYTTFDSVKKLNNKYQYDVFNNEEVNYTYMIIDNVKNESIVTNTIINDGFKIITPTLHINKDMGNAIMKNISLISLITILFSFVTFIFVFTKKVLNRKTDYLIMKSSGYPNSKIIFINNVETICCFIVGFILSLALFIFYIYAFQKIYLYDKIVFSGLNIQISYFSIIIILIITIFDIVLLSIYLNRKLKMNQIKSW